MPSDEEFYRRENVPVFEAVHGKGLISLGGFEAIDEMFAGMELQQQKLLDIGFGIGGVAFYLAGERDAQVWGLEVHEWMVGYANQSTREELNGKVEFLTYDQLGKIPLPDASIDLVYSKGVLAYVEDKEGLFEEVVRVLRPDGQICLIDWLSPPDVGKVSNRLPHGEILHKETVSSYEEMLVACGFSCIEFLDLNQSYLTCVQDLLARLNDPANIEQFHDVLSGDLREDIIDTYTKTAQSIEDRTQISCRIQARH